MKNLLDEPDFRFFSFVFDKEMGNKIFKDNEDFFEKSIEDQNNDMADVLREVCTICNIGKASILEDKNKTK